MASPFFRTLHARFDGSTLRGLLFSPRKPRSALLRVVFALLGVAILAVLLVAALFVGAAMIAFGLLRSAFRPQARVRPAAADTLDAEYRVVSKPALR
ncbi:MAG: hypothetical protein LCH70_04370 [Proteobacteria bacterium]|nr:hypothetical protein [Pseudomonadota bacterium]